MTEQTQAEAAAILEFVDKATERGRQDMIAELDHLKLVIGTLIDWIAQSSVSPLSHRDAKKLLDMLDKKVTQP